MHSTHWPAAVPVAAHVVLPSVRAAQMAAVHPVQALPTQNPLAAFNLQSVSTLHSTHCPVDAPVIAHTVFPSARVEHPVAPVVLHPVQALPTQNPLAGSAVHWVSAAHSTHWPMEVPVVAQVVLPSVLAVQPVAPGVPHPVQAPVTQNPLDGSTVHWASAVQPTHLPEVRSHAGVGATQALTPAAWQPTHTPATQNALVGSVQSRFVPQVPAASGTRVSTTGASGVGRSGVVTSEAVS
jgi:hypothetical protein